MLRQNLKIILFLISSVLINIESSDRFNTTFGPNSNGIVTTSIGEIASANSHTIDGLGNIFVLGESITSKIKSIALAKYKADGSIDTSFGSDGIVITTSGTLSTANDLIIDSSNNIIVAGSILNNGVTSIKLIKYDSLGNIIATFTESLVSATMASSIVIDGNGDILIAGTIVTSGQASGLICKYDSDFNLVTSFGTGGRLIVQSSAYHTYFRSLKLDSTGRIIASGGSSNNDFLLFRCNGNGVPDITFGTNGIVSTLISDSVASSIFLDSSDNIVAAGKSSSQIALAKYSSVNGSLIETFGVSGIVTTSVGSNCFANSAFIDSDGRIIITGCSDSKLIIVRYNSDGSLDTSFNTTGILTATIGSNDCGNKISGQIDGNYIISGYSNNNFALVNIRKSLSSLVKISSIVDSKTYSQSLVRINGTSTATSVTQVDIYIDNIFFTSVNTNSSGNWNAGASSFLSDGTHTIYAQFNNIDISRDQKTFNVDTSVATASAFGNSIRVDAIYGDDSKGVRNGIPFKTVSAALAVAQAGDVVWINPGTYNESITIPNGVIVRGASTSSCIIQKTNVTSDTTLVTMGENCSLEYVKLILTSSQHVTLKGVVFPGTSSATSRILFSNISVVNTSAGALGTSNVYGIHSNGTGQSTAFNQALVLSVVVVGSAGNGNKRALLIDQANKFNTLNSVLFSTNAGAGSSIGVETNNASALTNLNTTVIFGSTADIAQTAGTIFLKGSILQSINSNNLPFSNLESPKNYIFADSGNVQLGTSYLRYGTATASTSEIKLRVSQAIIAKSFAVNLLTAPGIGSSVTWAVRKNGVDTPMAITISDSSTSGIYNSSSVNFAAGDFISISQVATGLVNAAGDVVAIVDYY